LDPRLAAYANELFLHLPCEIPPFSELFPKHILPTNFPSFRPAASSKQRQGPALKLTITGWMGLAEGPSWQSVDQEELLRTFSG